MRVYYLNRKLATEELRFVAEALELAEPVDQIRIPHILPAPDPDGGHSARPIMDDAILSIGT